MIFVSFSFYVVQMQMLCQNYDADTQIFLSEILYVLWANL